MLQKKATLSFLIAASHIINLRLFSSQGLQFFSKSQCTARGNRDYVWGSDNHSGYPSNQEKRVENYLSRLTNKCKVVLSQKKTWGTFIRFVCLSVDLFFLI